MPSDREAWLAERRTVLTSTDMAKVLGVSQYGTGLDVYREKTAGCWIDLQPSPHQQAGLLLEPLVAEMYEDLTGRTLHPTEPWRLWRHPGLPHLACSIDRPAADRIVELKTVSSWDGWGDEGTDEARPDYLIQAHAQMAVTGVELVDIAALHRGTLELRVYPVRRHERIVSTLAYASARFWAEHVEPRIPPDPDFRHPTTLALLQAVRPTPGQEIALPAEAGVLVAEYQAAAAEERRVERLKDEAKARLLHLMGDAERGTLTDGRVLKRKVIPVAEHVRRASEQVRLYIPKETT